LPSSRTFRPAVGKVPRTTPLSENSMHRVLITARRWHRLREMLHGVIGVAPARIKRRGPRTRSHQYRRFLELTARLKWQLPVSLVDNQGNGADGSYRRLRRWLRSRRTTDCHPLGRSTLLWVRVGFGSIVSVRAHSKSVRSRPMFRTNYCRTPRALLYRDPIRRFGTRIGAIG
jgi:hypothetical protein